MNAHELSIFQKNQKNVPHPANFFKGPEPGTGSSDDPSSHLYSVITDHQYEYDTCIPNPHSNHQNPNLMLTLSPSQTTTLTAISSLQRLSKTLALNKEIHNQSQSLKRNMNVVVNNMDLEEAEVIYPEEESYSSSRRKRHCLIFSFAFLTLAVIGLSCWIIYLYLWGMQCHVEVKAEEVKSSPRFYEKINHQGRYFTAPPDWEANGGCVNLPSWANDMSMSVKTGGHCLLVFEHQNCQTYVPYTSVGVNDKLFPGSFGHDNLGGINMDKRISSFRRC